jgi:transposase
LLLRHGELYCGGSAWTGKHLDWLSRQKFAQHSTQVAFNADLEAVEFAVARRDRLDAEIAAMAADSEFTDVTRRLGCLRGVSTLTGFALAVEIGEWDRFTGKTIGAYVGLVPSEHSSGGSRRLGAITKTGNSHVRRLLIESAWHHRPHYHVGATLRARWELAPEQARVRAHAGNLRLHRRWVSYNERHKKFTVATTAIARELAGWCWSLAVLEE